MRKFEITEDQIKKLASSTIGRDVYMHDWFPQAFEPDWEELTLEYFVRAAVVDEGDALLFADPDYTCSCIVPLAVIVRDGYDDHYKIEGGKIWRRKA